MVEKKYIPNQYIRQIDNSVKEYLDYREGTVADSYIAIGKSGTLFVVLDTYETSWTSGYTVYSGDGSEADNDELWRIWDDFTYEYDSEYGEFE